MKPCFGVYYDAPFSEGASWHSKRCLICINPSISNGARNFKSVCFDAVKHPRTSLGNVFKISSTFRAAEAPSNWFIQLKVLYSTFEMVGAPWSVPEHVPSIHIFKSLKQIYFDMIKWIKISFDNIRRKHWYLLIVKIILKTFSKRHWNIMKKLV